MAIIIAIVLGLAITAESSPSKWRVTVGDRVGLCRAKIRIEKPAAAFDVDTVATIKGRCRIPHFGRRRSLAMSALNPTEGSGTLPVAGGVLCRGGTSTRRSRPQKPQPCIPSDPNSCPPLPPPPVLPRRCCSLHITDFSVPFDIENPPSYFKGTFSCPDESGQFELIRE